MNLPIPEAIEGESQPALAAFKAYCADPNRSIRSCARKLGKSATICARWSKKHHWQERLRNLETQAALDENQRAADADAAAKKMFAEQIERFRAHFIARSMQASEQCMKKALEIVGLSSEDSKPADAARLFAVAHNIGAAVTGLPGANFNVGVSGIGAPAPIINVVVTRDEQSDQVRAIQAAWLMEHPEHPQAERYLREYDAEKDSGNGH